MNKKKSEIELSDSQPTAHFSPFNFAKYSAVMKHTVWCIIF